MFTFLCLNALSLVGFLLHHVFFALVLHVDSPPKKRNKLFSFPVIKTASLQQETYDRSCSNNQRNRPAGVFIFADFKSLIKNKGKALFRSAFQSFTL